MRMLNETGKDICRICYNDEFTRYRDRMCMVNRDIYSDIRTYNCSICGKYKIDGIAWWQLPTNYTQFLRYFYYNVHRDLLPNEIRQFFQSGFSAESDEQLPRDIKQIVQKKLSAVSHKFKINTLSNRENFIRGNRELFDQYKNSELPSHKTQLLAVVYILGKSRENSGTVMYHFPVDFHSMVGAINRDSALGLVKQLMKEGYVDCETYSSLIEDCSGFYLTVKGIDYYDSMQTNVTTRAVG